MKLTKTDVPMYDTDIVYVTLTASYQITLN